MTYTPESLKALSDREIAKVAATLIFGEPMPTQDAPGIDIDHLYDVGSLGLWRCADIYGEAEGRWEPPAFATDPAASHALKLKMRELGWNWQVKGMRDGFYVSLWPNDWPTHEVSTSGDTEQRPFAEAAILAMQAEEASQ